jgi:hypothetical protein
MNLNDLEFSAASSMTSTMAEQNTWRRFDEAYNSLCSYLCNRIHPFYSATWLQLEKYLKHIIF